MVRDLLRQIQRVSDAGEYYLALFGALAVPSICGSLEAPGGRDSRDRYENWFDRYVGAKFSGTFSGRQCYAFRCAMLHQGRMIHRNLGYTRVLFIEPRGAGGNVFHNNVLNDALNLDVKLFCNDMVEGALTWIPNVEGTEPYETNLKRSVRRYDSGLPPYIVGLPVIS
jgi:hypothetical protein